LRGLLVPGPCEIHGWSALPSVRSFPSVKTSGFSVTSPSLPASPPVLRPLLTSRSASRRHPFRRKARSPQVRMVVFPAQSPDLRHSPLVARVRGQVSASPGSRRLISVAPHCLEECFLFVDSRFLLPASFSAGLTAGPVSRLLRLAVRSRSLRPAPSRIFTCSSPPCWAHTKPLRGGGSRIQHLSLRYLLVSLLLSQGGSHGCVP
jgi:hypothetical protein